MRGINAVSNQKRGPHSLRIAALALSFAFAMLGSGCPDSSGGETDAGNEADGGPWKDAGNGSSDQVDSGTRDAGAPDAGRIDAGVADAGRTDAGAVDAGVTDAGAPDLGTTVGWVLSYFGNGQDLANDSLHLAYSLDGRRWVELNGGRPVYQLSGLGTNHIRDPFILRKPDGTFVYLATDWTLAQNDANYWNRPSGKLVMVDSADLITFTNPRLVRVTSLKGPNGSQMHAWAPEAFYDADQGAYAIIWSGNDERNVNRIYVSYTLDFQTVTDPSQPLVYFDPGYTVIDASVLRTPRRNYLFFKDESALDIQIARSTSTSLAPGSFTRLSPEFISRGTNQSVSQGVEGPFAIEALDGSGWYLYADRYGQGGTFGGWKTADLDVAPSAWKLMSPVEFSFPANVRHGNVVRVTQAQLDALIARYGESTVYRLRSTYSENGAPFYVAHTYYHALITTLNDTAHGQRPEDFRWRVLPGLANPSDSSLVSLSPVGFPNRYLRVDSTDPSRYPECTSATPPNPANRGTDLCRVPAEERKYLAWVDEPTTSSATFQLDATFRRLPAFNGDTTMLSLQWTSDTTRALRHREYQLFATPISAPPAEDQSAASFILERE